MKTTMKTITNLAESMGFKIDRPTREYINVRRKNNLVVYTGTQTQEVYAWLQGYKMAELDYLPRI